MSSTSRGNILRKKKAKANKAKTGATAGSNHAGAAKPKARVYIPNSAAAPTDLEMDKSAYRLYHAVETHEACLSFDIIPDQLGEARETAPFSLYLAAGTQSDTAAKNALYVLRMANMHGLRQRKAVEKESVDSDSESSSSESESESESDEEAGGGCGKKPQLDVVEIAQADCVNRVRVTEWDDKPICAVWSERGRVLLYDLTEQMAALGDVHTRAEYLRAERRDRVRPLFTFAGHHSTGFALDFSRVERARLASGDATRNIHVWYPRPDGWHVSNAALAQHTSSVEDLAWSPRERDVLASASADRSIRVWDVRVAARDACVAHVADAHDGDVNVISWNRRETHFLVSGGDDAALRIWDLRLVKGNCDVDEAALATFKHHLAPITSVEWAYHDSSVFAASGEDDQVTQWDLAVEVDAPALDASSTSPKTKQPDERPDQVQDAEAEAEPEAQAEEDAPKKKKRKAAKKPKKRDEDEEKDEADKLPEQLLFIHLGQQEVKELHWHAQIPGLLVSTSLTGFNVFRTISV